MNNSRFFFSVLSFLICLGLYATASQSASEQDSSEPEQVSAIMALPYLQGYVKAPEVTGVTRYVRSKAYRGLTLYSSGHASHASLIDMKGNVLHEWSYPLSQIFPDLVEEKATPFWDNIYLYENGDLLAIYNRGGMIKLDKDSTLIWSYKCRAHHDIDLDAAGNIYTLTADVEELKEGVRVQDNSILILSPQGERLGKMSLLQLMNRSQNEVVQSYFKRVLGITLNGREDIFHANTLEILDGSAAQHSPTVFKKGNILICMLTISSIAIIDPTVPDMIWWLGPKIWFEGQHNPTLLPNGNILIFDNHYRGSKEQSRVLEFEPFALRVVREYKPEGFHTDTHGTNVPLPNGNILVGESNMGRIFEISPDNEIVWEFLNPHTTGDNNDLIAAVFAAYRYDPSYVSSWLDVPSY